MDTKQWVRYEDFRIDVGGQDEEYLGQIDRVAVRRSMVECMHGTVTCLKKFPVKSKEGKIILAFDLVNQKGVQPKAENLKVSLKGFNNSDLQSCLKTYWSDVRFPQHSKQTDMAKVKVPITVKSFKAVLGR